MKRLYYVLSGTGLWLLSIPMSYVIALTMPRRLPIASEVVGNRKGVSLEWRFRKSWASRKAASLLLPGQVPAPPSIEEIARATVAQAERIQQLTGKPVSDGLHSFDLEGE